MKLKLLLPVALLSCSTAAYAQLPVGNGEEVQTCPASAGYVYSALRKDCIRPSDQNIQLVQADTSGSFIMGGAVIFSDNNKMAEVFIPGPRKALLLKSKGNNTWSKGPYILQKTDKYRLQESGVLIYIQK